MKGTFIVLEGTDGSGKTAQFKLLVSRLRREGFGVATFDFPQYNKPSSYFVKEYLNGRYGGWNEVGPYKASLFYAMDRFDVGMRIQKRLKEGRVVVANRYVPSNMGHQGAKIAGEKARAAFFRWLYNLEYRFLGIPKPTKNIILHVPARIAQKLISQKGRREYLGGVKLDIHEADIKHLKRAEKTYLLLPKIFPREFRLIECFEAGRLLSIAEIHEKIWRLVSRIL
jgi:dTMP kinase